jgi:tRNA(Ile2) C34 agmatinyltransferase TiaS
LSETDIEEYISENANKTLRQLQAEIKENFDESKSLKWISKKKKNHEATNAETEETDVEHAPEIIRLKKKLRETQLKKEILMEKAEIEEIEELKEQIKDLQSDAAILLNKLQTAKKGAETAWSEVRRLRSTPCPTCAGKYITRVIGGYRCNLCGSYVKEGNLIRRTL